MKMEQKSLEKINSKNPIDLIEGDFVNALTQLYQIVGRHQPGQIPDFDTYFKDEMIPADLRAQHGGRIEQLNQAVQAVNQWLSAMPDEQHEGFKEWEHGMLRSLKSVFDAIYGDTQGQVKYQIFLESFYKKLVQLTKQKRNVDYTFDFNVHAH